MAGGVELGDEAIAGVGDVNVAFAAGRVIDGEVEGIAFVAKGVVALKCTGRGTGGGSLTLVARFGGAEVGAGGLVDIAAEHEEEFAGGAEILYTGAAAVGGGGSGGAMGRPGEGGRVGGELGKIPIGKGAG